MTSEVKSLTTFALKSLSGGVLIGFGCIVNMMCENKIAGAFLFSLGLLTVIITDSKLYTGKVGYAKANFNHWFIFLIPILILNLIGIGVLCSAFGNLSDLNLDTSSMLSKKYDEGLLSAFVRSFGCGVMMYIAVDGYKRTEKPIIVIMPVMCFILSGFEHCIANYGYMTLNNDYYCSQLIIWIIGNSVGSLTLKKLVG